MALTTRKPRSITILASLVFAAMLCVSQIAVASAAGSLSGLRTTGCGAHGGSGTTMGVFTSAGTYIDYYYWDNPKYELSWNACGSAAPYGSYAIKSAKQISAKFWVKHKDIDSCEAGFPAAFSCTATSTTTTATYTTAVVNKAASLTVSWNEVRFIDIAAGYQAFMSINGKNVFLGNEYNLTFNGGPL